MSTTSEEPEGTRRGAGDEGGPAPGGDAPAEPGGEGDDVDHGRDPHGAEDATLGGYFRVHDRPPAFEGIDGHPYTVSIEVEKTPNLLAPYAGYLVFPRWAKTGVGIVGHVETPVLWEGRSRDEVLREAGRISLLRTKEILDEAVRARLESHD